MVARCLAGLAHTVRVGGSIPSSLCVEFACFGGFLPQSKAMCCKLIGISNCPWSVYVIVPCYRLASYSILALYLALCPEFFWNRLQVTPCKQNHCLSYLVSHCLYFTLGYK